MGSFQKGRVTLKIPKVWHPNLIRYFLLSKNAVKKNYIVLAVAAAQQLKKIFWGGKFYPPSSNRVNNDRLRLQYKMIELELANRTLKFLSITG